MIKDTVVLHRINQQDVLHTMLREGAQRLIAEALHVEFEEFLSRLFGSSARCRAPSPIAKG